MKCIAIVLGLFLLAGCDLVQPKTKKPQEEQPPKKLKTELPDQTADSVQVTYSKDGVISLKLKAPKLIPVDRRSEKFNEFPEGVFIEFFNDKGEKNADLVADYGKDNTRDQTRYAKGNVVIQTPQGDSYTTDELFMNDRKDSIHNYGKKVKITRKDGTLIQGKGFVSDAQMKNIEIEEIYNSQVSVKENNLTP